MGGPTEHEVDRGRSYESREVYLRDTPGAVLHTRSQFLGNSPLIFGAFVLARERFADSLLDVMRDVRVQDVLGADDRSSDEEAESDEQEQGLLQGESTARAGREPIAHMHATCTRARTSQSVRRDVSRTWRGAGTTAHALVSFSKRLREASSICAVTRSP